MPFVFPIVAAGLVPTWPASLNDGSVHSKKVHVGYIGFMTWCQFKLSAQLKTGG